MRINSDNFCGALDLISRWSMYIMIFTLSFAKSVIEITIVTALISLILKKVIKREKLIDRSLINLFLVLFFIASLASLINTSYMKLSLRALFSKTLKFAALFLVTQEIINTRQKLIGFCTAALISCGVIIVDGLLQYYVFHVDFLHKYTSFGYSLDSLGAPTASFPFPNDYAAWIIMFLFPVGIYSFFGSNKKLNKTMTFLAFIGLFYSLALTRVKGAFIGFFVALGFFSVIRLRKIGAVLLILSLAFFFLINITQINKIFTNTSSKDRGVIWNNSVEIFKKHPIIGNGVNTFFVEYMNIRDDQYKGMRGSYAHNCYLQMAADIGILGLLAFLLFVGAVLIKGLRSASRIKDPLYYSVVMGVSLGLISFLIHSAADTNLYSLNLTALFWMSAGLVIGTIKIANKDDAVKI